MKISERVALIRAGYTRADIEAMIAEEAAPAPEPEEQPEPDTTESQEPTPQPAAAPEWAAALQQSIGQLTQAVQMQNLRNLEQPEQVDSASAADKVLGEFLNGGRKSNG